MGEIGDWKRRRKKLHRLGIGRINEKKRRREEYIEREREKERERER